jgi:hypothetical protein
MCIPVMQLHDQLPLHNELLVLRAAVSAFTAQDGLIPPAACCNVSDGDEWLGLYGFVLLCGSRLAQGAAWLSSRAEPGAWTQGCSVRAQTRSLSPERS